MPQRFCHVSDHARRVIFQNLGFAMAVILVLIVSAVGYKLPLPIGVIGHEGSSGGKDRSHEH